MSAIKERLLGAITTMNDDDALSLWEIIVSSYSAPTDSWDDISEVPLDEWDIAMMKSISSDPDCMEFVSSHQLKKELGMQ